MTQPAPTPSAVMATSSPLGTIVSNAESPTFESIHIKLRAGQDIRPNELIRIPVGRTGRVLVGRVRAGHEHNPHESPDSINVRDALQLDRTYPTEEDSTVIYRIAVADILAEIVNSNLQSPETLPEAGSEVFRAGPSEVQYALGLVSDPAGGLFIGHTTSGLEVPVILQRESIQRHFFIGGTTGSGKSYAMTVLAEELIRHHLPIVFLDTRDDYRDFVLKSGGRVVVPGKDFSVRISSLTDSELLDLIPTDSELQRNIISAAFLELKDELADGKREKFLLDDLLAKIDVIGPPLTNNRASVDLAKRRTAHIKRQEIFGEGVPRANWPKMMVPCLSIACKHLKTWRLQSVATALLRELEDLRMRNFVPPMVIVIDEAHLFVPERADSPCKQIIRETVRIGRHHGLSMVLLTQSPVDIDRSSIRQCNTRMIFALEPDQLDAIRGVKSDATDEMLRALPKLPQGTCLLSGTYESVKHSIPVRIRTRTTKDVQGGETPPIFDEMKQVWLPKLSGSQG
jgi:DNA helicase HerA-like ATPase